MVQILFCAQKNEQMDGRARLLFANEMSGYQRRINIFGSSASNVFKYRPFSSRKSIRTVSTSLTCNSGPQNNEASNSRRDFIDFYKIYRVGTFLLCLKWSYSSIYYRENMNIYSKYTKLYL